MSNAIDGTWEMIRAELDGEAAPEMFVGKTEIEIASGMYAVRFGGVISDRGSFELGGTLEGPTIILNGIEGPNAGRTIPCIYQRVGDRLRVCYGLSGVAPTEFATASGQQRYLATYRLKSPAQQV